MWTETEKHYAPIAYSTATIPLTDYEQFKKDAIELRALQQEVEQIKKDKSINVSFEISFSNKRHKVTNRYIGCLNEPIVEIGTKLDGVKEEIQESIKKWWQGVHMVYSKEDLLRDLSEIPKKPDPLKNIEGLENLPQIIEYINKLPSWVKWLYPLKTK